MGTKRSATAVQVSPIPDLARTFACYRHRRGLCLVSADQPQIKRAVFIVQCYTLQSLLETGESRHILVT